MYLKRGGDFVRIVNTSDIAYPSKQASKTKEISNKNNKENNKIIKDQYIPGEFSKKITYDKPKVDQKTIQKLMEESERTYSQLKEMVRQLLERQGLTFKDLDNPDVVVKVDEEARLEAQAMISEGGPLSPEVVSARIVDFAKAISGGDKEKFEMLKSAIDEGFKEAARILGGELPEVSHKTYELVMEKLNAWVEEE